MNELNFLQKCFLLVALAAWTGGCIAIWELAKWAIPHIHIWWH
jgi:hypothetical protein